MTGSSLTIVREQLLFIDLLTHDRFLFDYGKGAVVIHWPTNIMTDPYMTVVRGQLFNDLLTHNDRSLPDCSKGQLLFIDLLTHNDRSLPDCSKGGCLSDWQLCVTSLDVSCYKYPSKGRDNYSCNTPRCFDQWFLHCDVQHKTRQCDIIVWPRHCLCIGERKVEKP